MDTTQNNNEQDTQLDTLGIMRDCDYITHPDYDINPMVDDDGVLWWLTRYDITNSSLTN